jgi:hypothetical protein
MAVLGKHCPQNGHCSPHKGSKSTILANRRQQGMVLEEWWDFWTMDGKWRASSGQIYVRWQLFCKLKKLQN